MIKKIKKIDDQRLKAIAKRLQFFRLKENKTQAEIAKAMGITGVQYCRWESGEFDLSLSKLIKLADFYKISVLEFFIDEILKKI